MCYLPRGFNNQNHQQIKYIMSVKVAIRVRPFNQRQKFLGCLCCVEMRDNTTVLYENRTKNKKQHYFTFDYSFWSHDQFQLMENGYMRPTSDKYVDQDKVHDLIGREMLANAWQGYNCCMFAYGQTGSGKSYSMIGYGANRGIIPMTCQEIFKRIKKYERKGEMQYELTLSMIEIYNQKVQDLFVPTAKRPPNGLKIRENKTLGVYVQGLTKHQVFSYEDIQAKMEQGSKQRSLASTLMNEYSSRAHTLVLIEFIQKQWINKLKMNKKTSCINLVDLAGSERVAKTGILGNKDRLKEASNINKSLHTLGRVIEILAEQSTGKGKNLQVPYRDSSLTRILQSALGGNSKTVMICAISPANDNYEETLSTLRYADQTKKIKNKPIINQSAVDKIIRQLRQENDRLKKMLDAPEQSSLYNSRDLATSSQRQIQKKQMRSNVRASIREVQKQIRKNLQSFAINTDQIQQDDCQSLMMTQFIDLQDPSQLFSQLSFDLNNKAQVFITNLNQDDLLSYKIRYSCQNDILITNKNNKKSAKGMQQYSKIVLCGLGIQQNHAKIIRRGDKYYIQALSQTSAEYTLLNGKPVYEKKELKHNDRIILGINSVFLFKNNLQKNQQPSKKLDYEYAVNERQQQMEAISLISPTSLNLFYSNSLKGLPLKDIYSSPSTNAYNQTKKLFQTENDKDIMTKLIDIQSEFNNLVRQNQQKLKQKQEYYKNQLHTLRVEKQKQVMEKSSLQQKLMIKSIQSETLKNKTSQIQKLKQKLAKYQNQKDRRKKIRESMLLQSDQNQQILIEQFVDVEDPSKRKSNKTNQIGIQADFLKDKKHNKQKIAFNRLSRQENNYDEELLVQQYETVQEIRRDSMRQSINQTLLIAEENQIQNEQNKKSKAQFATNYKNGSFDNIKIQIKKLFHFRRLYNIKILCEKDQQFIHQKHKNLTNFQDQNYQQNKVKNSSYDSQTVSPKDSFITKYISDVIVDDAELQQFTYKSKPKIKQNMIGPQQFAHLLQQIGDLQKIISQKQLKQQQLAQQLLLNDYNNRQSYQQSLRKESYDRLSIAKQLNLNIFSQSQLQSPIKSQKSQQVKPELKIQVSHFIQILAQLPELAIYSQASEKILPTVSPMKIMQFQKIIQIKIQPEQVKNLTDQQLLISQEQILLDQQQNQKQLNKQKQSYEKDTQNFDKIKQFQTVGVNTEKQQKISQLQYQNISFLNEQNFTKTSPNATAFQFNPLELVKTAVNTSQIMTFQQNNFQVLKNIVSNSTNIQIITDINMQTQFFTINFQSKQKDLANQQLKHQMNQSQEEDQIQNYIQNNMQKRVLVHCEVNTQINIDKNDQQTNTMIGKFLSISTNTQLITLDKSMNTSLLQQNNDDNDQQQLQAYLNSQNQQLQNLQKIKKLSFISQQHIQIISQNFLNKVNKKSQNLSFSQFNIEDSLHLSQKNNDYYLNITNRKQQQIAAKIMQYKLNKLSKQSVIGFTFEPEQILQKSFRNRPQMIDQQTQMQVQEIPQNASGNNQSPNIQLKKLRSSVQLSNKLLNQMQLADKFNNLSFSQIQKNELSYQQLSVMGLDGLLRQDDNLNQKIKILQARIKELELQPSNSSVKKNLQKEDFVKQNEEFKNNNNQNSNSKETQKAIFKSPKPVKKKKKKNQMTPQQRRQAQIQRQLQAQLIQCNNQNLINERNLQIHKRKRQSQQLRKVLLKKQKVQLQKQLLVLIPMIRRFNLLAKDMKRLIEAKLSLQYRNFSHYEMIEILKGYNMNKSQRTCNIQIKVAVLNCQEGRIYTWPAQVFKNRFEIAEQVYQKYLQNDQDSQPGRHRAIDERSDKAKDPFWDPVDYVPHGIAYLSMQVLLYNLSYQGYISFVYKQVLIAKMYVSITPVKLVKQNDQESVDEQTQDLENIQISNQRNLLQKDVFFTISIQSIKFLNNQEKVKNDQTTPSNDLNSNILKYMISYELLEDDYKVKTYNTEQIDYVHQKQFKRVDYMRRHSLRNISEATLSYLSDCPLKFTLNVVKDYYQQVQNASFNQSFSQDTTSQLDVSGLTNGLNDDKMSQKSFKNTTKQIKQVQKSNQKAIKSDFSKKPVIIYQNTQVMTKLQEDSRKQTQRRQKIRRMAQAQAKQKLKQKVDKEKQCVIF